MGRFSVMLTYNMIIGFLFIIGLMLGSFVNALVWRIHEVEKTRSKIKRKKLSILKGRSMCPNCEHQLAAKDLAPLGSWVVLKGKCRYCKKAISWHYPLIELVTGLSFVLFYQLWPFAISGTGWLVFAAWLLVVVVLLALAVYDLKWMELPDRLVRVATVLSVVYFFLLILDQSYSLAMIGYALLGPATLFGIFYLLFQVSKGSWIGGGDVKLAPALGLLAGGLLESLLLLFLASLIGSLIGIPLLLRNKQKNQLRIPFGPLLITAVCVVVLCGPQLLDWYKTLIYIG